LGSFSLNKCYVGFGQYPMTANSSVFFSTIWAIAETIVIIFGGFKVYLKLVKKLDRIEYAIFNDGKTGLKNDVEALREDIQEVKTDLAVLKAASNRSRSRKAV
jgi:hypothetical protein